MSYKRRKLISLRDLLRTMTAAEIRLLCDWCQFVIERARKRK